MFYLCQIILRINFLKIHGFVLMPTLVFIPGLLCTHALFETQIVFLEKSHKIMVADTTGLDSISAMAERILAQTNGPLILFGLSMGGYIAMEVARLGPSRVRGLGLFSTGARADSKDRRKMRDELVRLSSIGKFKGVTPRLLPKFLSQKALQNQELTHSIMQMAQTIGQHNFALQQKAISGRIDQRPFLPSFTAPSCVVCGVLDELTPPELSVEMAELMPNCKLTLLETTGHLSTMEAPESCLEAMQSLIERTF